MAFDAYNKKMGIFTFNKLCAEMLGAADYLALARRLNTVILTNIPKLNPEQRNEAKRFVTLIDTLYEHKVKLICTAEVPTEEIYEEGVEKGVEKAIINLYKKGMTAETIADYMEYPTSEVKQIITDYLLKLQK